MKKMLNITSVLSACLLMAGSITSYAQDKGVTEEVAKTIRQYYKAMATRDVQTLRSLLESTYILVEADRGNTKAHVLNTRETSNLLPPEGNDDWENLVVSDLKVSLSSSNSSVATVSYSLFHPIDPEIVKMLEDQLKAPASQLDKAQRQEISKQLEVKGCTESEHAMLALRDGRWRIVSISVTK